MTVEQRRGMQGKLKTFDQSEHDVNDKAGKDAFMRFLNANRKMVELGLRTIENRDAHGIDLLTLNQKGEVVHCWEIEVRHGNWRGHIPFPFREINCIERKDYQWRREQSFIKKIPHKLAPNYRVTYVQLNRECTRAVCIEDCTILQRNPIPWPNRKAEGEFVRQVPISMTTQYDLTSTLPRGYRMAS